jgi:hypothetical protein
MAENSQHAANGSSWLAWVLVVVLLIVAAYLGNRDFRLTKQLDADQSQIALLTAQADRAQALTDTLISPNTKMVTLGEPKLAPLPVGHVAYLPQRGSLIFVASRLRTLAANKSYELWMIPAAGKAPVAAGMFHPDAAGSATIVLPPMAAGITAKSFIVTIEDASGAATPTLPIVLAGN